MAKGYRALIVAISVLVASPAFGDTGIAGFGTASCGTYVADYDKFGAKDQWGQWILGFLSGYNLNRAVQVKWVDEESLLAFATQYCTENPLHTVFDAAAELTRQLPKVKP